MSNQHANRSSFVSLAETYRGMFDIGAAINASTLESSKGLLQTHYNSITAENDMKFERIHPEPGVYTFEIADRIAQFASDNGMKMRGHTLVWHNQTPAWVFKGADGNPVSREELLQTMKEHIDTVAGRYKGRVYCWDVVNEVIEDKADVWLRQSPWLDNIGEDFIGKAFEFAHAADPSAQLFYNDYNECQPEKRDKIMRLLKGLLDKGVPVHGMGLQAHWNLAGPSLEEIRQAIESYASLGLRLHITELDISVFGFDDKRTDLTEPTSEMMELQAERYDNVFALFREYRDVIDSVTFWGAADDYTWLHDFPVRGRRNWPLVFDRSHQPKASFHRITQL
ncbi:endo-1,4-beta-xylanase [Paenibacillus nanensis]|uniref:Beta-xylanase n=1 Tax=Paenibacillus nanensis TaxID=393251 RepID=A0A3A1UR62_9BACL|nr:endo-1,4-beta-xylanase [Paenibacillus nanensis]RIX50744.1 endo-1,4-beta-xylanase [Paenibacillus nanensis]